jgi:hypothetical protein
MKQETEKFQWFYSGLKPFVHYIPIREDLGDLIEKIKWARENDEKVKQIAIRGQQFALDNLLYEQVMEQYLFILNEYTNLFRFKVK